MIQCSESCVHEYDGLCALKEVTTPSKTPKRNCPYFNTKQKKIKKAVSPLPHYIKQK